MEWLTQTLFSVGRTPVSLSLAWRRIAWHSVCGTGLKTYFPGWGHPTTGRL